MPGHFDGPSFSSPSFLTPPGSTDCMVAVQSQSTRACDRRSSADRVKQQRDHDGRSYCHQSTSCASADRQQTDHTYAIEKSPREILNSSKFLAANKIIGYSDSMATGATDHDDTATFWDHPPFSPKIGRGTVAISVTLG